MSGENKHTSFFPPEDSPITVPPAEEAWSLMRPMLDKGMPVTGVKGSWFRNFRWLAPAAVVAGVSIWLVVHKPLRRDTGRVGRERVSVGKDKLPVVGQGERSGGMANGDREGKTGVEVAGAKDSVKREGGEIVKTVKGAGERMGKSGGTAGKSGGTAGKSGGTAGRAGGAAERVGDTAEKVVGAAERVAGVTRGAGGAIGRVAGTAGKAGAASAIKRSTGGAMRRAGSRAGRAGGAAGPSGAGRGRQQKGGEVAQKPTAQSGGGGSGGGNSPVERIHHRHEGKAQMPSLALIGPGYDRSRPGSYASLPVAGWKAGKGLLPGKAAAAKGGAAKGGKDHPGTTAARSAKAPAGKGERIFAIGLWDGLNFAVDGQTAHKYTPSDGPDLLPDHLPGAYVRMYMGDRVYIDAGLRLYSPQYTRLQQIDSTGGYDTVYTTNPIQTSIKDTVVSLEKLYYTDIPLTIHYRVAGGLYLGGGLQYSRLWDGAAIERFDSQPSNRATPAYRNGNWDLDLKYDPGALARLRRSDWRVLLDVSYRWKRFALDLRYQQSLTSYVRPGQGGSTPHNSALQLNLSYDIWWQHRKK